MRLFNSISLAPLVGPDASSRGNVAVEFYRAGKRLNRRQDKRVDLTHVPDHRRRLHVPKLAVGGVVTPEREGGSGTCNNCSVHTEADSGGCKRLGKTKAVLRLVTPTSLTADNKLQGA